MCAECVYCSISVSTQFFPASFRKNIQQKMCLMHDSSDICGAQFLYMSHSLHLTTLCTQFYIVIYSRVPQNLPASSPSSSSPTSCLIPLLLFNWQPQEKKAKRRGEKGAGQNYGGAHVFFFFFLREKLPKSPAARGWGARPNCWGAPLQLSEL